MGDEQAEFDRWAGEYETLLKQSLAISGETKEYFAQSRIEFDRAALHRLGVAPVAVLDYGCGTGTAGPLLKEVLRPQRVLGVDVSPESLKLAGAGNAGDGIEYALVHEAPPAAAFDFAYTSGTFHHIPPADRPAAVAYVRDALRPGGAFAFWEHNPFNPGTRYSMSQCPFDCDAQTLRPAVARRLLRSAGFQVLRTDYLFIFPRSLRALRPLERSLSRVPLGAQYRVLCRRPI